MAFFNSKDLDDVFQSLINFNPDLMTLEQSGNLTPLIEISVPWNKGISGYKRQPHSEESKNKISKKISVLQNGKKRKPFSDETRRKMSEAKRKQYSKGE